MAPSVKADEQTDPVVRFGQPAPGGAFESLFNSIGRSDLQHHLLRFVDQVCGADSVHLFQLVDGRPDIACGLSLDGQAAQNQAQTYMERALWRGDSEMAEGSRLEREVPILYRMDTNQAPTSDLRDFYHRQKLIERLMVCGRTPIGVIGFSVMRSSPRRLTSVDNQPGIDLALSQLFPLVAKHMEMVGQSRRLVESLTTLPLIERYLTLSEARLPQREVQVAARLLYGLSASCIASDLGIGSETVSTHRKRLYARLGICCHHELLLWYLKHCSNAVGTIAVPAIAAS